MDSAVTEAASGEGLDFHLDSARSGATFDGHRVIHLAGEHGLQDAMKERLLRAYFSEGELIGDTDTLVRLAVEVGLDEDEVRAMLATDRFSEEVRADERLAGQFGISAVPTFVVDRALGASGAHPPEALLGLLEQGWANRSPVSVDRRRRELRRRRLLSRAPRRRLAQRPIISSDTSHSRSASPGSSAYQATPPAAGPSARRLRSVSASLQSSK